MIKSYQLTDIQHSLLSWVDFLIFGIQIALVKHEFMNTCWRMLHNQASSGVTWMCDICTHYFLGIMMFAGHCSGFELLLCPYDERCVQLWGLQHREDRNLLEPVQGRPHNAQRAGAFFDVVTGWESWRREDSRNTSLQLFSTEGSLRNNGDRLFNRACCDRTRVMGLS